MTIFPLLALDSKAHRSSYDLTTVEDRRRREEEDNAGSFAYTITKDIMESKTPIAIPVLYHIRID